MLIYSLASGKRMVRRYAHFAATAEKIRSEAALGHLWFEEAIAGDIHQSFEQGEERLNSAEALTLGMLQGDAQHPAVKDPEMVRDLQHVLEQQREFRQIAEQRHALRKDKRMSIGGEVEQRFDAIFENFLAEAQHVETSMAKLLDRELARFRRVQILLATGVLALGAFMALVLYKFIQRRELDRLEIESREEDLSITLKSIGDAVIATDAQGNVTRMNPVAEALTGWKQGEAKGVPLTDVFRIVNAETGNTAESPVDKVLREGKIVGLANHTLLIARNGEERQIADSGAPIVSKHGSVAGVVLVFRDVAGEYQREAEMVRLRKLLKNAVDSMPSVLLGVDMDGRITLWNQQASAITGISADEAQGKPLVSVFPGLKVGLDSIRETIRTGIARTDSKTLIDLAEEKRISDVTVYPLVANGVQGAVVRVDDVTERVRIEEMMIQSEKMMSVGGLAAGMAHEINNPLGVILQAAQNALRRTSPDIEANVEAAAECGVGIDSVHAYLEKRQILAFLEDIREGGARAAGIVGNMLQFSRRSESKKAMTNISELINRAVDLASSDYDLKKKYDFKHVEIVREFDPNLHQAFLAATEIEQVLLNLLKNAAQAMAENHGDRSPPRIVIRTLKEENWVRIEVEDNGPGMEEADRKRAFEPFFTTKGPGFGTGLGLAVSYMIVTGNHQGTMDVDSSPGLGAKFIVRLPIGEQP